MADYSNSNLASGLLKTYYEPGIKDQIFNSTPLLMRLKKNTRDIQGGAAKVALHTARMPSVGSRPNGWAVPAARNPTHAQASIPLRYTYGHTNFSGPDLENTKGDKGAFASLLTNSMKDMGDAIAADCNRQLFSDGSGILCVVSAADDATPITIHPYIWDTAGKYIATANTEIHAVTNSFGTPTPASTATSILVTSVTTTTNDDDTLAWTTGTLAGTAAGDPIGKFNATQYISSNTMTQIEMMGLFGICHDTNLIGDADYQFDLGNSTTKFNNVEIDAVTSGGHTYSVASCTNELQGVDANANSYWRAYVDANKGIPRALDLAMIDKALGKLRTVYGAKISVGMTTYQVINKYADLVRQDRRYLDKKELNGGWEAVMHGTVPLIADKDAPRGMLFLLDESTLSLYPKVPFEFVKDGGGSPLFLLSGYDAFEVIGRTYMNLGCHCRNKNGVIRDISES